MLGSLRQKVDHPPEPLACTVKIADFRNMIDLQRVIKVELHNSTADFSGHVWNHSSSSLRVKCDHVTGIQEWQLSFSSNRQWRGEIGR